METAQIDSLLERYLHLVHEYTTLRAELCRLQADMYMNIARANFSAERGVRYGQDFYDDRMQAARRLAISSSEQDLHTFQVVREEARGKALDAESRGSDTEKDGETGETAGDGDGVQDGDEAPKPTKAKDRSNPLRWFGLLAPMPLRQAQGLSIQAIDEVIPKLVSVSAEMAQVEIQVRRARKRRAKAEAVTSKEQENVASKGITA